MKKIPENFIQTAFDNYLINFSKSSIKMLLEQVALKLSDELQWRKLKESYLLKYNTKELVSLLNNILKKEASNREFEIILQIINILYQRQKDYHLITGNHKISPETIDEVLFPTRRITTLEGTNQFTIVNWNQLHIKIRDINPNIIVFHKIIEDKPSDHSIIERNFDELHLGLTTRAILRIFGYLKLNESYKHPLKKKDQVFRLNRALKQLFKMPNNNNPFFWKKNQLNTKIIITAYDDDDFPVLPFKHLDK